LKSSQRQFHDIWLVTSRRNRVIGLLPNLIAGAIAHPNQTVSAIAVNPVVCLPPYY